MEGVGLRRAAELNHATPSPREPYTDPSQSVTSEGADGEPGTGWVSLPYVMYGADRAEARGTLVHIALLLPREPSRLEKRTNLHQSRESENLEGHAVIFVTESGEGSSPTTHLGFLVNFFH
jgi:hypothetical protein